jgi:hypothetical protein
VIFLPRREELARLQQSPILSMGPDLETTRVEPHFLAHYIPDDPGQGPWMLDARPFEVVDL